MRFAIATMDRYLGVFEAFVHSGWVPVKLFCMPLVNTVDNYSGVATFAEKNRASIQLTKITHYDFLDLRERSCDVLIVACHKWKIGEWQSYLKYAVNFHSSPLPEGRGPYPIHRAIMEKRKEWAVTCHRLTSEFDQGEILAAAPFLLDEDECYEKLHLKIQMSAKNLAYHVAGQFEELWKSARPQNQGSYWPKYTLKDRVIDFSMLVDEVLCHIRAFGATESLAMINGTWLTVKRAVGWIEQPHKSPGSVVHINGRKIVVATPDGYIGLIDVEIAQPQIIDELRLLMKSI